MGRVLTLVRELVRGRTLDRHGVSKLLKMTPAAADRFVRDFVKHWPEVVEDREGGRRVLRWSRTGTVPDAVAVAACFGASLSRLFDGSNYESGLREARRRVLDHVKRPQRFEHFERKFYFVQGGGEMMLPDNAAFLDEVVDAVLQHNPVVMTYRRFSGHEEELRIRPLSIAVYDHQLYVIGRDDADVDHPFRFSRISCVEREGTTFEYPSKAEYDPDGLFNDSFGIFVGGEHGVEAVELRLNRRWKSFVSCHRWHRSQKIVTRQDHLLVRMRVRLCPELKAWILGFGPDAEVLAPTALRDDVRATVAAMGRVYPGATRD